MARVLVVIHSLRTGGAERVALQWCEWLLQEGHQVQLVTPQRADRDFYPLPPNLQRRHAPPLPGLLERLGPLVFPLRVRQLNRLICNGSFNLALGITALPAIKLLLAARGTGLPVVVSERIFPGSAPLSKPWCWLRRLSYPWAALHVVQTEAIADWLKERQLAQRIRVLPNAIRWPLSVHQPCLEPADVLGQDQRFILAVGTKPHQKGFDRLVAAWQRIAERHPGWRLVLAGLPESSWPQNWEALPKGVARPLLPGRVGNLGAWYAQASLFVLSSRYEGIPNVLLEAMAYGCACLAVDCPTGPAELIRHDQDGWLLPEETSVAALAEAMETLIKQPELRRRLGRSARSVRDRFAESRIRAQMLEALAPWLESPDSRTQLT